MFTVFIQKQDVTTSEIDIVSGLAEIIVPERFRQAGN